jgi:hypothetical protein
MDTQQKHMLMQSFLRDAAQQQQSSSAPNAPYASSVASSSATVSQNALVLAGTDAATDVPVSIDQFREYVRKWMELDNTVKKAQILIREKRKQRDALSIAISKFMCKYDIEDLNTKEGRIRCKVTQVKAPLNQKVVKEKIASIFQGDEEKSNQIIKKLYDERDTVQKVSLRRLKIE